MNAILLRKSKLNVLNKLKLQIKKKSSILVSKLQTKCKKTINHNDDDSLLVGWWITRDAGLGRVTKLVTNYGD